MPGYEPRTLTRRTVSPLTILASLGYTWFHPYLALLAESRSASQLWSKAVLQCRNAG